ncbi:diguanylate cyclase domain-containing protein [Paracidovorax sp. MALMAid1276]|uniref:sensor domain-containing diguanylate cyclase n=1 Tax=Paracidovorax sp. MALMAid1276 TaxID=3411631 RepID=UPI003B9AB78C
MPLQPTSPETGVERQRRRLKAFLVAGNVGLGLVLFALVAWVLESSHKNHALQARATAEQFVAIAAANIEAELRLVDAALLMAGDELHRQGFGAGAEDAHVNELLASRHSVLTGVEGFRVADHNGLVRWGNHINAAHPLDLTTRDFFHQAKSSTASAPVVSGPVHSRISGNWVIAVARPLVWDGAFHGVLYATLNTQHFTNLFARYDLADQDAIALRMQDQQLLAWLTPGSPFVGAVGDRDVSPELTAAVAAQPLAGAYRPRARFDGVDRTIAYRAVPGWPLLVQTGLNNARFFAQWKREMRTVGLMASMAWALGCAATLAVYRFGRRTLNAVAELDAQSRRTTTLLRVAGDGIHVVDRSGHMVDMSDSFAEMHGCSRQDLQGQHVSAWDANQDEARINTWLAGVRDGDRQRVEVQHRRADGSIIDVDLHWRAVEIDGQLLVFGSARDITEKKQLVSSLKESESRIRDLYDQAPCGHFSLSADGRLVHANAMARAWLGGAEHPPEWRFAWVLDRPGEERFGAHMAALVTRGAAPEVEVGFRANAAMPARWVRLHSTAVQDAFGAFLMSRTVATDITVQHLAQQRVEALLRDQAAMLNSDIVGMAKLRDRRVSWKNAAFERMLGYAPGELDGVSMEALCAEEGDHAKLAPDKLAVLAQGQNYRADVRLRRKSGEALWVNLNGVQLSEAESFWMAVDISEAKRAHAQITHVAFHDALTQLPNRLLLLDRLQQALAGAERSGHTVAVCFMDLDGFKAVNDAHGHDAGDRLLVEVGRRIVLSIRATDTAARFGGDEFVALLAPVSGDEWRAILGRLMRAVAEPMDLGLPAPVRVGLSVGVALSGGHVVQAPPPGHPHRPAQPPGADQAHMLLSDADEALLQAKRAGKNRIELAPVRP